MEMPVSFAPIFISWALRQDQAVFTAVLATSLTYDKAFMLQGVDKLRHGVLVLLHRVRNFLLRHGPLVP